MTFQQQLARLANRHQRKAETAGTDAERDHWEAEANRFQQLANLAETNPTAARAAYRPTRAFEGV